MPTGTWPIAEETPVGAFRTEIGDSVPVTTPAEDATTAEYEFFSDTYLQSLLTKYADDPEEGMASALDTIARRLMIEAEDIKVDDIAIKTIERAKLFENHAASIRAYGVQRGGEGFTVTSLHTTQSDDWDEPFGTPHSLVG